MTDLIIFLCGQNLHRGKYEPFDYIQSGFIQLAKNSEFNYWSYCIKNIADYNEIIFKLSNFIFKEVLIIYTGHGSGVIDQDYPAIVPTKNSFDIVLDYTILNLNKEKIKFKYIFDCCNKSNLHLNTENNTISQTTEYKNKLTKFLSLDFNKIYLRKGLFNWTNDKFTLLTKTIIDVILNYDYNNLEEFLGICNYYLLTIYKNQNKITNKNTRYVLDCDFDYNKTKFNNNNKPVKLSSIWINIDFEKISNEIIPLKNEDDSNVKYINYNINTDEFLEV